jgi:UDP-GlcNAc:undecaprenyl-phosphate/decaprenyl-phosphate GlcNAc-1-phosphate transferase
MVMVDFLPLIVVGFAASLGLTPLTRQLAARVGLMDKPSPRKVHRAPIPLMGGLAIYGAFLLALLLFRSWPQHIVELGAILVGATWLALIGLLDDRMDLAPWIKFPAQFVAAAVVVAAGIRVDLFNNPLLDVPLSVFWIVGIINAINFLDNMDGLAAGISAICAIFLFILSYSQKQELVSALAAALGGSAIGFLVYNFNPATTFMGDMGSLVLGFVLAVLGIKLRFNTQPLAATWMIPILVLGLPIFDTTLVVFTRLREKRSPFKGGKDHASHRLVALGLSHRLAVLSLYIVSILLGVAAIVVSQAPVEVAQLIGIGAAAIGVGAFIILEITRQLRRGQ